MWAIMHLLRRADFFFIRISGYPGYPFQFRDKTNALQLFLVSFALDRLFLCLISDTILCRFRKGQENFYRQLQLSAADVLTIYDQLRKGGLALILS